MPQLVSPLQTAFIKGRSIMESFMVTKELINYYNASKVPAILYKVDFTRAFDSISWTFLAHVLIERGFPPIWIGWILNILKSSSSQIVVNGTLTQSFTHKRGLRQGDPLSPLLFNLVADTLQSFLKKAQSVFTGPMLMQPKAVQFADDTVIIAEAYPNNLKIIAQILHYFATISGLKINNQKSTFVPISIKPSCVPAIQSILGCNFSTFPVTYLGLPLSIKRPTKAQFLPLIEKMQQRIQGWQTKFLSLAGRITLVKAVLSAMPLHFLQAMKIPKWVLNELDTLRRSFLWKGSDKCTGGQCLVNWDTCTLPKRNGGLGITHLSTQNDALLLRWLWKLNTDSQCVWSTTIAEIYGSTNIQDLSTSNRLSHNLKSILHLTPILSISTVNELQSQQISWRWTTSKLFSAKSAYCIMHQPGCLSSYHSQLWKLKAPPKIKVFMWLLLLNRILTKENLHKRGWTDSCHCSLCTTGAQESATHLFLECNFVQRVYTLVNRALRPRGTATDIHSHWKNIRNQLTPSAEVAWLATIWNLWKERNKTIFQGITPEARRVAGRAIQDAAIWVANY